MATECVFCKIIAGDLPSTRVFEDPHSVAFMDIGPVTRGHVLVVPREHYESIVATPVPELQALIATARRVVSAQMRGLAVDAVRLVQSNGAAAGQVVPHIHFHLIPCRTEDRLPTGWRTIEYESPEDMQTVAQRIADAMPADADGR